ncbi:hypothetical protein MES5069_550121 [Mesorhizobium escarrei]|uniref:DUF982 domain-containing protein n=1 Tax=Mesorhizobium escarrei TaxID=666018 RepID=A0ABN8KC74_9HYPH|nr:hypothetical protein MES5069_550121 [Mesorhizobium escarrei]
MCTDHEPLLRAKVSISRRDQNYCASEIDIRFACGLVGGAAVGLDGAWCRLREYFPIVRTYVRRTQEAFVLRGKSRLSGGKMLRLGPI